MNEKLLVVKKLSKTYGLKQVVKQIDLEIKKGSFTAILGPNGAGKSTTISMLATLTQATSGDIYYDGLDIKEHLRQVRPKIGIVFQDSVLDETLSVKENLSVQAGLYKNISQNRIDEVIALTGLMTILKQPVSQLSGGQKRRVDIAVSVLHQPQILFLDEPTTGLDIQTRMNIWQVLQNMQKKEGMTIVLTTHYLEETNVADNVYIINNGEIIANGSAKGLIQRYTQEILTIESGDLSRICNTLGLKDEQLPLSLPCPDAQTAIKLLGDIQPFVDKFSYQQGTMNDVFVALTGKEMRS